MKISLSDRKHFATYALKKHIGIIGIWLAFLLFGSFFAFIGYKIEEGNMFIIFGTIFIMLSTAFVLYTLPSSFKHYYEQALTKKYGSFTNAKITNKIIENYSHTTSNLNGGKSKLVKEFLYKITYEFSYNNITYNNECFFENKSTFDAISKATLLPIKFLKTNPKKVTLRRRKLSNSIGVPEKMCQ